MSEVYRAKRPRYVVQRKGLNELYWMAYEGTGTLEEAKELADALALGDPEVEFRVVDWQPTS